MIEVLNNIALWIDGNNRSDTDVWFLPGFAESHLCFRDALKYPISKEVRCLLFDPPGFGASPARTDGITIGDSAILWKDLITHYSNKKNIVLVAHSVAGIIATETVKLLEDSPALFVSVEGNLTEADAYFSGQALNYDSYLDFYQAFSDKIYALVMNGTVPMSYYASFQFADPKSLWVLGRSTRNYTEPGVDYHGLKCPTVYYWCDETLSAESKSFLKSKNLRNVEMKGLGHWPMNKSPERFYSQLFTDILLFVN